ncbi:YjbH domain-containing protein [Acetobacteraceae bacterium H6797]|nr:YjbH domain-containing protein [Acetobacteraceae bacterium H6797]
MGLIEMRNARFREDGTLETGASIRHQRRFWFLNLQALPFLETTFRLTERLNATIGQGMTTDRAFDLKIRLMQENEWRPALAIGLQDLIGTGLYAGEYLVASKRWHDLDFTLGLGWGRLGTGGDLRNPLSLLRDGFDERPRDVGRGGTLQSGFFRGRDAAVFGGVEWRVPPVPTPWGELEGLIAKAEWSGDDLRDERGGYPAVTNGLRGRAASRLNAGLQWSNGWMDAGFHAVHGTDFLFRLSFRANPAHPPRLPRPALPVLAPRPAAPMEEAARAEKVFAALKAAGFHPIGFGIDGGEARIAFADGRERTLAGAANRVLRAVQPFLPRQVEMLRLSWWQSGGEVATLLLPRGSLEAIARHEGSLEEAYGDATLEAADGLLPKGMRAGPPLDLQWGLEPKVQLALGDPSRTLRWQGAVEAGLRIGLPEGFAIAGSVQRALIGNLADGPSSDSQLAHVRSDYGRYAREGETSIPALYGERLWNVAPDLFARASLGYLEPMFGGVSGEVLWRPHGERWALGADINWVQQRDFDQKLGFRGYRVATGHVSAYADLPWWNLYGVVRAGRYLAGDWGATIELGRRFDSGIEIGGFATFTDVPFSRFGEGSFDKGIYVRIPLEIFGSDTRSQGTAMIRPVVRDGGQRLSVDSPLWEVTRDGRQDAFQRGVSNFGRQ